MQPRNSPEADMCKTRQRNNKSHQAFWNEIIKEESFSTTLCSNCKHSLNFTCHAHKRNTTEVTKKWLKQPQCYSTQSCGLFTSQRYCGLFPSERHCGLFDPVTVACLCVCDTLKTSREATNLILNQSVVEKPLPLLDSQQQDYISSFPEIFLLCSYHPLGLYNVKKKKVYAHYLPQQQA